MKENELIELLKNENIESFKVQYGPKPMSEMSYYLEDNNIEDFIKFLKANGIKSVFYTFYNLAIDDFIIDNSTGTDIEREIYHHFSSEINAHNEMINSLDLTKPYMCTLFCLYQSREFIIDLVESDYNVEELMTADDKMMELVESNKKFIENLKLEREEFHRKIKEELKNFILSDSEFHICTNDKLRRNYLYEFYKRENVPQKFKDEFIQENGFPNAEMYTFIELFWKEFKSIKKMEKY